MRRFISFYLMCLVFLMLMSCDKTYNEPELIPVKLIIGDTLGDVNFKIFNPPVNLIAPTDSFAKFYIDMDNDGYREVCFHSNHSIIPDFQTTLSSTISTGINYSVSSFSEKEIIHRCTLETEDTIYRVYYNKYSDYCCEYPAFDTIYHDNWNLADISLNYKYGENLPNEFIGDNFCNLAYRKYSEITVLSNGIFYNSKWDIIHDNWNNIENQYLIIKSIKPDRDYFGWIKISVNNYKEIIIQGYAMQKYH